MICHDCKWEADGGNKKPHECKTKGCTCQHILSRDILNHDALSKSKTNSKDAGSAFSKSNRNSD